MTLIEAADLIRLASYSCLDDDSKTAALNAIIPAVITVMDAARADALEEAAEVADAALDWISLPDNLRRTDNTYAMGCLDVAQAIRGHAKHREPKP